MADTPKLTPLDGWIGEKIGFSSPRRLDLASLRQYQAKALQAVLARAVSCSKFYGQRYAHLNLSRLTTLEDLQQLPLLREQDLVAEGKRMLCVGQEEIHRIVTLASSGTMGIAKKVYFSRVDQELTIDFFHRGMATLTEPGERVLILLPCQKPGCVGDLLAKGLARLGATPLGYGVLTDCQAALQALVAQQATGVVANPYQLLALAYAYEHSPFYLQRSVNLQSILLSTDYVPQTLIKQLERIFKCPVYEHYGMTEMGLGGGVSCENRQGYHLREADLYVEVVDPVRGLVVENGTYGEIVFTTLTREAMPLIRYATGDRGRFSPLPCPCGTVLPVLEKVKNRLADSAWDLTDFAERAFAYEGVVDFAATWQDRQLWVKIRLYDQSYEAACKGLAQQLPYGAKPIFCYGLQEYDYTFCKKRVTGLEP